MSATLRTPLLVPMHLTLLAACASTPTEDLDARARNDHALRNGVPSALVVIVENGKLYEAEDLDAAYATIIEDRHRYVFSPGEEGDRGFTLAYLPAGGIVAGDAFAESLGLDVREDASGRITLARGDMTVATNADRTIAVTLSAPSGARSELVRVSIDPRARGSLLMPSGVALRLLAPLTSIPGTTHVEVALGRPFAAHRARLRVELPELDAEAYVEIAYLAPAPETGR